MGLPQKFVSSDPLHPSDLPLPLKKKVFFQFFLCKTLGFRNPSLFDETVLHVGAQRLKHFNFLPLLVVDQCLGLLQATLIDYFAQLDHEQTVPVHLCSLFDSLVFDISLESLQGTFAQPKCKLVPDLSQPELLKKEDVSSLLEDLFLHPEQSQLISSLRLFPVSQFLLLVCKVLLYRKHGRFLA